MKLIGPFKQLLSMDGLPEKGPLSDDQLKIINNAGIMVSEGKIKLIGDFLELKNQINPSTIEHLEGEYVAFPGMIDVHTHICWTGSRANDYAMRLSGKTYLEIAAAGGGIWDTVLKTRSATLQELAGLTLHRANLLLKRGITTIEVKSGYGLTVDQELKMLEAIDQAILIRQLICLLPAWPRISSLKIFRVMKVNISVPLSMSCYPRCS
jgi:imidazolonepropionase